MTDSTTESANDPRVAQNSPSNRIGSIAVGIAIFLGSLWLGLRVPLVPAPGAVGDSTRDESVLRAGRQIVFVFVGSSRCGPSNAPGLAASVAAARDSVRRWATSRGLGFVTIGVAREWEARSGLAHLEKFGEFDELAAGQGGLNQAAAHFISRDLRGIPATPQVIVVARKLRDRLGSVDHVDFDERVLLRKVGSTDIRAWAGAGARVPLDREARVSTNAAAGSSALAIASFQPDTLPFSGESACAP